tara:strand:- start:55 stop:459 length:405 start_codon:yes stop_codon:yes gene_type:complete
MAHISINEVKNFKYECEKCLRDWIMSLTGQDSRRLEDSGYFCPYCSTKHTPTYPREELPRFATDKEAGFVDTTTRQTAPKITQKGEKPASVLEAEDRITHARCTDGGWWNPITKQCQGEGVGHNVEELDNDRDL